MAEFASQPIGTSLVAGTASELVSPGSRLTYAEIGQLFELDSPLLRENPYALASAPNTARARRADWRVFVKFCAQRHYSPLPAAAVVVREFVEAAFGGTAPKSVSTVERYLSTIAQAHTLVDLPDPSRTTTVRSAYRHLSRGRASSQPKAAIRGAHVTHALEHLETGNSFWDLRAKALLATAYCTMARRSELVALRIEDLTFNPRTRDGVALIRNTKAGREEARFLSADALQHLRAWTTLCKLDGGPVFRRILNTGRIAQTAIAPQEVARIFQRVAHCLNEGLGVNDWVWPNSHVGAHSTRIGAAHDLAAAGIDLTSIMHSGGWNDPKMPRYYTRELAAQESGMARMIKGIKRGSALG